MGDFRRIKAKSLGCGSGPDATDEKEDSDLVLHLVGCPVGVVKVDVVAPTPLTVLFPPSGL